MPDKTKIDWNLRKRCLAENISTEDLNELKKTDPDYYKNHVKPMIDAGDTVIITNQNAQSTLSNVVDKIITPKDTKTPVVKKSPAISTPPPTPTPPPPVEKPNSINYNPYYPDIKPNPQPGPAPEPNKPILNLPTKELFVGEIDIIKKLATSNTITTDELNKIKKLSPQTYQKVTEYIKYFNQQVKIINSKYPDSQIKTAINSAITGILTAQDLEGLSDQDKEKIINLQTANEISKQTFNEAEAKKVQTVIEATSLLIPGGYPTIKAFEWEHEKVMDAAKAEQEEIKPNFPEKLTPYQLAIKLQSKKQPLPPNLLSQLSTKEIEFLQGQYNTDQEIQHIKNVQAETLDLTEGGLVATETILPLVGGQYLSNTLKNIVKNKSSNLAKQTLFSGTISNQEKNLLKKTAINNTEQNLTQVEQNIIKNTNLAELSPNDKLIQNLKNLSIDERIKLINPKGKVYTDDIKNFSEQINKNLEEIVVDESKMVPGVMRQFEQKGYKIQKISGKEGKRTFKYALENKNIVQDVVNKTNIVKNVEQNLTKKKNEIVENIVQSKQNIIEEHSINGKRQLITKDAEGNVLKITPIPENTQWTFDKKGNLIEILDENPSPGFQTVKEYKKNSGINPEYKIKNIIKEVDLKNAKLMKPHEIMQQGYKSGSGYNRVVERYSSGIKQRCVTDQEGKIIGYCPAEKFENMIFGKGGSYSIENRIENGYNKQIIRNSKGKIVSQNKLDILKNRDSSDIIKYTLDPGKYKISDRTLGDGTTYRLVENRKTNQLVKSYILNDSKQLNFNLFRIGSPDNLLNKSENIFAYGQEFRVQKDPLGKILEIIPDDQITSLAKEGSNFSHQKQLSQAINFMKEHESSIMAYFPPITRENAIQKLESTYYKLAQINQFIPKELFDKLEKNGFKIVIGDIHPDLLRQPTTYGKIKKTIFSDRFSGFYYYDDRTAYCGTKINNKFEKTTPHEIGHAFDHLIGNLNIGASPEMKNIHVEIYDKLRPYISVDQGPPGFYRGQQELFADAFADYLIFVINNGEKTGKNSFILKYNEKLYNYLDKFLSPYFEKHP